MTVPQSTIQEALIKAIRSAGSNTSVILNRSNFERPKLPYTTINMTNQTPMINDWYKFDKVDDVNRQYGYRELTFSLNFYGDNSVDESRAVQGKIITQTIRDELRTTVGASILNMGQIRDISSLVDSGFEERYQFDLTLFVSVEDGSTEDDTGYFDQVAPVEWTNEP